MMAVPIILGKQKIIILNSEEKIEQWDMMKEKFYINTPKKKKGIYNF